MVAGAYLDLAESGMAKKGDTGVSLYEDMVSLFSKVASPFAIYQQRFEQLEPRHLQLATSSVSKDMRQASGSVSSPSVGLDALRDAVDRLKDLAPYIFVLAEGSLDRFELLSGGYRVGPALTAVGKLVADHVDEIVIAIKTLSVGMTADINQLADAFDEQLVLCAMEVLKLAGNFRRDLRGFEGKTRERLTVLSERIETYFKQASEVEKATSRNTSGTGAASSSSSSFSLPDSLTVVEIDSILTRLICGGDEAQETEDGIPALTILNQLATIPEGGDPGVTLYPEVEEAVQRLAGSCHAFVFDVCSAVPRKFLAGMAEMTSWKEGSSANAYDSYGTLPQPYISQVGEHMLALVQALEPFAADTETLSVANEVMQNVKDVALQPWGEFASAAGILVSDETIALLMKGTGIGDLVLHNAALTEEDAALEEGASEADRKSAAFCNTWLDLVGSAVTAKLLERIMRIPQLTQKGCEHLNADLNYLINVFSALGVAGHPHPLVSHFAELSVLSDEELRSHILARDRTDTRQAALRSIEARMALLRGVALS